MEFVFFLIVGFFAQIVDGALGMAYGIICMTILLSLGIAPAAASAGIHTAEIFTTGISGLSHAMFKNIDYRLLKRLILPGMIGSIIGAMLLTVIPTKHARSVISIYLLMMGLVIIYRAFRKTHWMENVRTLINEALQREKPALRLRRLIPIGLLGGMCDAIGGGGWGAFVNASLLAQDDGEPRYTIGTTNLAEFLVTLASSLTFALVIGISHWPIVLGLILGGALAAPFSAYLIKILPPKILMFFAGLLILILSLQSVIRHFI